MSGTASIAELAQWVPLRLTPDERALLAVLEQTMNVSEYTDNVDVTMYQGGSSYYRRYNGNSSGSAGTSAIKTRRILDGILEASHIATGLATASGEERKLANLCLENSNEKSAQMPTAGSSGRSMISSLLLSKRERKQLKKEKKKKQKLRKGKKKKNDDNDTNTTTTQNNDDESESNTTLSNTSAATAPWGSRNPDQNAILFQTMFEIGRRNKVLNPSSMRTTYGKLMYLLQDAQNPTVAKSLGFSLHKDLMLVAPWLEQHKCSDLLTDPRLECAVQYIGDRDAETGEKLDRTTLQALVEGKRNVTEELVRKYTKDHHPSSQLNADQVRRAIESLADAIVYIESNVRPVQRMLHFLKENFHPEQPNGKYSLALRGSSRGSSGSSQIYARYGLSAYGSGNSEGPTLSHSHSEQFTFVEQSLKLWCKVMRHMHRLWVCADDDLLSTTSTYHLYNTGQGLNRVQNCPRVRKVMSTLLHQTQQETGKHWVGLSVIHLGDRDVPNALIFIDKYTQIPRFLNPIVTFLQCLPSMVEDKRIADYIHQQFGNIETLKMVVLQDYFKHGFDGSGDDGGSCIDGRLTSSWNWTSRLAKKSYYHAFMLSGFQGFDGDFR